MTLDRKPSDSELHDETAEQLADWAKKLREDSEAARTAATIATRRARRAVEDSRILKRGPTN